MVGLKALVWGGEKQSLRIIKTSAAWRVRGPDERERASVSFLEGPVGCRRLAGGALENEKWKVSERLS